MKKIISTISGSAVATLVIFSTLTMEHTVAQGAGQSADRVFIKEEGDNLSFKKIFNKGMNLRFSNQNNKMLDLMNPYFKDKTFMTWIDSQPDGVKKQMAFAMSGAQEGRSLEFDRLIADLRDFVDPTGVKWKIGNGGALTYFKTIEERGQVVRVEMRRRTNAAGEMVDMDSYVYEGVDVPDASLLRRCLERNKDYSNSRWILEESTTDEGSKKFRLVLRGSIPVAADPKMVRDMMGNLALTADAIEKKFLKPGFKTRISLRLFFVSLVFLHHEQS